MKGHEPPADDCHADRESMAETVAILADEDAAAAIRESLAEIRRGDTQVLTKDEALALITRR